MKEKWNDFRKQMITFWQQASKRQRAIYITGISLLIIAIITITIITSKKNYVALPYNNLSLEEVGQVKEELDSRNVDYIIEDEGDRKSTRLNSSHVAISYAVFCLKKKKKKK